MTVSVGVHINPSPRCRLLAQTGGWRTGRACPLCPGISDINLFRYCQGIIDLDAEISDRAFDLGMPQQELDSPQVACPPIDQGSFCAAQGMRPKQPRVQSDASDPFRHEPRILARCYGAVRTAAAREGGLKDSLTRSGAPGWE